MELLSDLVWSPDGSHLVFVGQDPRDGEGIFSIKFNGTDLKQLTDQRDFDDGSSFYTTRGQRLTWSSDGQILAFVRNGQNDLEQGIWIIRSDGSSSPEMITGE
jgi:Tol biopolymer transport system component